MHVPQTDIILRHEGEELVRVTLPPGEYVIGRNHDVEIFADTPLISRRHARLTINYDHLLLEDLGSSNGTYVNDRAISDATRLYPNQAIRLGTVELEIRRQRAAVQPGMSMAPAQATIHRLLPGELLGDKRYAVGSLVAQGGMGAVLSAQQSAMKRNVAMKVMIDNAGETEVFRFIEEAQITGQLAHPNIVPVYELGVDENDQLYYTMKMVRGITLRKVLELLEQGFKATLKKYPLPALLTIFQKVCDAIGFAHSKGIIHRDIKPENIMLDDFGVVLVMDWGLAKAVGAGEANAPSGAPQMRSLISSPRATPGDTSRTLSGTVLGTPAYMSPEQARGEVDTLDARSDIYALGAILYHILALRAPVADDDPWAMVERVTRGDFDPLTGPKTVKGNHLPGGRIPDSLGAVVRKAMALEKDARYRHVADLQSDIEAYQNGFATTAEKAGAGKQMLLAVRRNKGVATSIGAGLILLIGVITAFTIKVIGERNRAEHALADLQKAAPALLAEGQKQIDAQQFDDALAKISFATTIDPKNADYRLLHAQVLETKLQLAEAATEFRQALALNPSPSVRESAQANLALCTDLLARYPTPGSLDAVAMQRLYDQFRAEGRNAQAVPLAALVGKSRDTLRAFLEGKRAQWRLLPGWPLQPETERIKQNADGSYVLNFTGIPLTAAPSLAGLPVDTLTLDNDGVSDLRPLAGVPLAHLSASNCRIVDLAPLHGMPLHSLTLVANHELRDLSPLRGMPLRSVSLSDTSVEDFSALKDSPLMELTVSRCPITNLDTLAGMALPKIEAVGCPALTDISGVKNMPLRQVNFHGCSQLRDFSPLLACPRLEFLRVSDGVPQVTRLREHPRVWRAGTMGSYNQALPPADQFFDELAAGYRLDAESEKLIAKARAASVAAGKSPTEDSFSVHGKGLLSAVLGGPNLKQIPDFHGLQVTWLYFQSSPQLGDLGALAGLPLRGLSVDGMHSLASLGPLAQCKGLRFLSIINGSNVSDLSPLRGLPLTGLIMEGNYVSDLTPLKGMPLRILSLQSSKVSDLSLLSEFHGLRDLSIAYTKAGDLRPLQKLRLERLDVHGTPTQDLSPLSGMPLRSLNLYATQVRDLSPLAGCAELEELVVPNNPTVAALRHHPKLRRLSYSYDGTLGGPSQTVAEFWKDYDETHAAPPK